MTKTAVLLGILALMVAAPANMILSSITQEQLASAINQSTSMNCADNKCVSVTCVDNNCHETTNNISSANNTSSITLGSPFFKQYDKSTGQKVVVVNGTHASEISFSGNGTANGINFIDSGKALAIPKGGGVMYIQGHAIMKTNVTAEKATYTFFEIGKSSADGTLRASGAAFFGSDATGKFAFLNNTVAIYKDQIDKAGNGKVIAWRWQ